MKEDALERFEIGASTPLRRLEDIALVTDAPCRKIKVRDRIMRPGRYTYFSRGYDVEPIDDFTMDGKYLLVGRLGTVCTSTKHLLVVPFEGKGMPSELFSVVVPYDEKDFAYLEQVLRATMAPPLMQGNDIVQEITPGRLGLAIIPWPELSQREAFTTAMEELDRLAEDDREMPEDERAEHFKAVEAERNRLGAAYLRCTHDVGMLMETGDEATDAAPAARTATDGDTPSNRQGGSSPDESSNAGDGAVIRLLERMFGYLADEVFDDPKITDVVSATGDLGDAPSGNRFDLCICIPAPNQGEWTKTPPKADDPRWTLGIPPRNKANYAWIMQTVYSMDNGGYALLLLCNAALVSSVGREEELRKALASSGLIECIIALPGQIFGDGRAPSSIVVLRKTDESSSKILMVDASEMGSDVGEDPLHSKECHRTLESDVIEKIADAFIRFDSDGDYPAQTGLCSVVSPDEIAEKDSMLSPWLYV